MSEQIAGLGHNNPPPFDPEKLAAADARVKEWMDAAGDWLDLGEIRSEDQAARLTDMIDGARKVFKAVDEERKEAKKPHDEAGKAVQAAYTPLLDRLERTVAKLKPLMAKWLTKKEAEAEAERARMEAEAKRLAEEAERLAAEAAARNDINAEIEAEEAAKAAARMAKEAARETGVNAKSATGGARTVSLREQRFAVLDNPFKAFAHFQKHPDMIALLERLATAELRASKDPGYVVPGFTTDKRKVAA
jgi:hypothetical protein